MIVICLKKKEPTIRQLRRKAQKYLKNIGYKTKKVRVINNSKFNYIILRIVRAVIPLSEKLKQKTLYLDISSLRERGIKETVDTEIIDLLDDMLPF